MKILQPLLMLVFFIGLASQPLLAQNKLNEAKNKIEQQKEKKREKIQQKHEANRKDIQEKREEIKE